jgi:hypothetical protein
MFIDYLSAELLESGWARHSIEEEEEEEEEESLARDLQAMQPIG